VVFYALSGFINGFKKSGIKINRRMLADMAVRELESFANLVTMAKGKVKLQDGIKKSQEA
jgi:large subunit ribosomal protein L20